MPVKDHADFPRPREHLRILDGHLIINVVCADRRKALDQMHLLSMKVSRLVEPCVRIEMDDIDDERVALPPAAGVAHPPFDRTSRMRRIHENIPNGMHGFEE